MTMKQHKEKEESKNFVIADGLRIDLDEGWKKIISRQFGGSPGRGFGELIQNFLDSYLSSVPWNQRRGVITFGEHWVSLKDYGSGLDLNKIKLVTSMGGTDKHTDPNKIGKFGIGFFSIFNKVGPFLGPLLFAVVRDATGSSRTAILFLIVFFILGALTLFTVSQARGREEAAQFGVAPGRH